MTSPSEDYNLDVIDGVFCMDCGMDFDEFGNCDCVTAEFDSEDDSWDDADSLIGIGWGTDEDYGYYGD